MASPLSVFRYVCSSYFPMLRTPLLSFIWSFQHYCTVSCIPKNCEVIREQVRWMCAFRPRGVNTRKLMDGELHAQFTDLNRTLWVQVAMLYDNAVVRCNSATLHWVPCCVTRGLNTHRCARRNRIRSVQAVHTGQGRVLRCCITLTVRYVTAIQATRTGGHYKPWTRSVPFSVVVLLLRLSQFHLLLVYTPDFTQLSCKTFYARGLAKMSSLVRYLNLLPTNH
jgi:hypothetical protein